MAQLQRKLGAWDGAVLIFSNVVGVGIFTTPGIVAKQIPDTPLFLLAWLLGGAFAFIGALGYAQLSSQYPKAGGEYIYLRKSFGPLAGFLSGWTSFVAGFSGAIAASAVGFGIYLKRLYPTLPEQISGLSTSTVLALFLIVLVATIHILNVKAGSRFHYWLGGLALVAIVALVVIGLAKNQTNISSEIPADSSISAGSFTLALIPILFTFSGWNAAVYIAEEIKNPEKNMFRALLLGTVLVTTIYLVLNFLFVKSLGIQNMGNSLEVGYDLSQQLLGRSGSWLITSIILLALLSSVSAMIMAGPRIYFAMARDGLFPRGIQKLHPKYKTPYLAIVAQSVWSMLLVVSGTFEDILIYTGFSIVLFSGMAILSLLLNTEIRVGTLKKTGYWLFVFASLAILINGLISAPKPSLFGVGIIALGIPVFYWFRRQKSG